MKDLSDLFAEVYELDSEEIMELGKEILIRMEKEEREQLFKAWKELEEEEDEEEDGELDYI